MRFLATLINAFSRDSLRCALWFLLSYMLAHYRLTICLFLFLSPFLSLSLLYSFCHTSPPLSLCPALYFSLTFCLSDRASICLSVPPMCCLCVYTCDERHWIICTTGENGWSCNKVVEIWTWESRVEFWGILRDLPESGLNRRDLKRVTFLFTPASFRESGENIEFMKVSVYNIAARK